MGSNNLVPLLQLFLGIVAFTASEHKLPVQLIINHAFHMSSGYVQQQRSTFQRKPTCDLWHV